MSKVRLWSCNTCSCRLTKDKVCTIDIKKKNCSGGDKNKLLERSFRVKTL